MMSRTLGAPLGGTTRGGQYGAEFLALSLIVPPNGIGGGGSCFPPSVTVAPGEPGTPLICWACAARAINRSIILIANVDRRHVRTLAFIDLLALLDRHVTQDRKVMI